MSSSVLWLLSIFLKYYYFSCVELSSRPFWSTEKQVCEQKQKNLKNPLLKLLNEIIDPHSMLKIKPKLVAAMVILIISTENYRTSDHVVSSYIWDLIHYSPKYQLFIKKALSYSCNNNFDQYFNCVPCACLTKY